MTDQTVSERMHMPRNKALSEQMRAESREKILSTARALFAEYSYAGCSMSDIASRAKMSKANKKILDAVLAAKKEFASK